LTEEEEQQQVELQMMMENEHGDDREQTSFDVK
jgi:hypothetical protein